MSFTIFLGGIYLFLVILRHSEVSGATTVTTSDVVWIPNQQALTLRCRYTTREKIILFTWSRKTGSNPDTYTQILRGSVSPQITIFQDTWESKGVFRGDYTSTLDIELPANFATSSYAGTYRCQVSSISNAATGGVTASVLSAPSISEIPSPHRVNESSRLQIDCSIYTTVANPSTTNYTWTYKGSTIISGPVLDISSISRSQTGQYICTATNTQGSDSEPVNVDVQYGPGSSVTVSPQGSLERVEGSGPFTATCTADCNPSCSISWRKGSTNLPPGQLSISNISRTDQGDYTCQAQNGISGPGQKTFTLTVYYLHRPELTLDKADVRENETIKLSCSVVSNPTVQMTIKNIDNDNTVVQKNTNTLSYTIQRVQCLHNGMFVCSVENHKTGTVYTSSKRLNVLCSPQKDNRQPYVDVITRGLGEVASFVANVISNPAPSFIWFQYIDNQLIPIPNSTVHFIITSDQQSVLQITVSHNRDYGQYTALVENNLGKLQIPFSLSSVSPPKSPDEMTVDNKTATTVSLRWKSNDNGGSEQTFNVEYQTVGSDWRRWKEGILDPGKGMWLHTVIPNLIPNTQYFVQVYSQNHYGKSDNVVREAKTQSFEVAEYIPSTSGSLGTGVGIGIAASAPIIIGLIIALVVFLHRRPQEMKGGSVTRHNPLRMGNLENQGLPSTYADLQREHQTGNEYEKIDVPRDITGSTADYENADHL